MEVTKLPSFTDDNECLKSAKVNTKELKTNMFSMIGPASTYKIISSLIIQERVSSAGLGCSNPA